MTEDDPTLLSDLEGLSAYLALVPGDPSGWYSRGIVLHELTAEAPSLEQAFLELTAGETGL